MNSNVFLTRATRCLVKFYWSAGAIVRHCVFGLLDQLRGDLGTERQVGVAALT
jgi:hypothetical protein